MRRSEKSKDTKAKLAPKQKISYEKIIVNNYWLDEPFHSSFVKILYCISENDVWIKSLKSQGAWYLW